MTKLDRILKRRDITWSTKAHLVNESWTIRKAERQRINAFELWCWRRLLQVSWTARKSNQSILKEINQSCVFIGRTDVEAETPILWPPDEKS